MCGIAGIVSLDHSPVPPKAVEDMAACLAHRGPDDVGFFYHGHVGLGHRRLATLDTGPSGHQPMVSDCGQIVVVYNGMLFNFRELRTELRSLGFEMRSDGDTAVVTAAWLAWGQNCLSRFNGHFSLAVLDKRAHALYLARDRYGTRPLYWYCANRTLLFASEIKAFFTHPAFAAAVDLEALPEYFTFQNFLSERTLFEGVRLFPKASVGKIDLCAPGAPHITRYWDYAFASEMPAASEAACGEELEFLLRQAVNRHLVADVEVGAYLSGGIDSGMVSALAAADRRYIKSFTCGFDISSASGLELGFDERIRAEAMSNLFKTEHYEIVLKSGDMERIMPHIMRHLEEPRVGQSYPNYYIAQLASKFVKIVLSGAGGDELFAGYPWRYYPVCATPNFSDFIDGYYDFWQRLIPSERLAGFLAPVWSEVRHVDPRLLFRKVFDGCPHHIHGPEDAVNLSLYFEAHTFLQGLLLVEDKLSMAHGLETRAPFLDNDLVDFALKCPVGFKLRNLDASVRLNENDPGSKSDRYLRQTRDGKHILRQVAGKYIPESVIFAEKQGFSAPDASWFKGESLDFVKRRLLNSRSPIYDYIDRSMAFTMVGEHLQGKTNRRLLIWSLLCFDYWLETFIRRNPYG